MFLTNQMSIVLEFYCLKKLEGGKMLRIKWRTLVKLTFLEQKEDLRVLIEDDEDAKIAKELAIVELWCIQWHPTNRPSMKVVTQMLGGNKLTIPPNPFASTNPTRMNLDQKFVVILEQE